MPMYTNTAGIVGNRAFLPDEVGPLVVRPVEAMSVALQVATVARTAAHEFHIPIVSTDPAAAWTVEGAEIAPSDAVFAEAAVPFSKLASLTVISSELANDSSPAAAEVVGQGMARSIAQKIDAAFFGSVAAPAPDGLGDLVGFTPVVGGTGGAWTHLDGFLEAVSKAGELGVTLTAFVTNPATALALAKIRLETTSVAPLLQPDPTQPTRSQVSGVPIFVSPGVVGNVVWGIDKSRVFVVLREDTTLEVDRSAYFSSDRVGVRATLRAGFGFAHPASLMKIAPTA